MGSYKTKILLAVILVILLSYFLINDLIEEPVSSDTGIEDIYEEKETVLETQLSIEIIPAPNDTYGYDIKRNGDVLIHQPNIPALPGNEGFKSAQDAEKVAELVVVKINNGIFPPGISVVELDSVGVLHD